ncbi:MAG: hypothetical protein GY854_03035 [Deltaproteobacteria bacterium]|nr:hypothetical protein [Deltaproteobacteria bacterium]
MVIAPLALTFTAFADDTQQELLPSTGDDAPLAVFIIDENVRNLIDSSTVIDTVQAQLTDIGIRLHIEWLDAIPDDNNVLRELVDRISHESAATAAFWLELRGTERALHLFVPSAEGGIVSKRPIETDTQDGLSETVGIIVRAAIDTILRSNERGQDETEPEKQTTNAEIEKDRESDADEEDYQDIVKTENSEKRAVTPPPSNLKEPPRMRISAAWCLGFFSKGEPPSQGAFVELALRIKKGLYVSLDYLIALPINVNNHVDLEMIRHPIGIGLSYQLTHGAFAIAPLIRIVFDPVIEKVSSLYDAMEIKSTDASLQVSIWPGLVLSYKLIGDLSLIAIVGMEIYFKQIRYTVKIMEETESVFEPFPVQPQVALGFAYSPI